MPNIKSLIESKYVSVDLVKESPTKKLVILDEGEVTSEKFGKQLTLQVQMDKKMKEWRPNKQSMKNLAEAWGEDTGAWLNKIVALEVEVYNEKEIVVAKPFVEDTPEEVGFD